MLADTLLCGVEGGASHSIVVLCNGNGKFLSSVQGPSTNHWMIGIEEVRSRIVSMVKDAIREAGLPLDHPIKCICMSLTGAEEKTFNAKLKASFESTGLANDYLVCSDTRGPIAAVHEAGGVVLIAGTGSNALLVNPDGSEKRCGGWGHMLGDEGSAFGISKMALKIYFDDEDGLEEAPKGYETDVLWRTIQTTFQVKTRAEMLPHLYSNFAKSEFAKLCRELARSADNGDPLCQWLFFEAGRYLAKHLIAVSQGASEKLLSHEGGLAVACVGSIWKSWQLMKPGFTKQIESDPRSPKEFSLLKLTDDTTAAKGAVFLAAQHINFPIAKNYANNYNVFHYYKANVIRN